MSHAERAVRASDELQVTNVLVPLCLCRKLLREHQLESVTKTAQQDELERRRRLEQHSKQDFPAPRLPEYTTGKNI